MYLTLFVAFILMHVVFDYYKIFFNYNVIIESCDEVIFQIVTKMENYKFKLPIDDFH